jgi:lysophospholipase
MGGHIAIRSVLEGSLDPDGLIVTAPMIALPIGQIGSLAAATFSRTMSCLGFDTHYGPGMADYDIAQVCFDGNTLTGDRDRFYRTCQMLADAPDLAVGGVTWGWISAAFLSMGKIQRLSKHVQPSCPALICTPMEDRVVSTEAQSALSVAVEGWNQVRFDGARHELLMETDNIRNRFWPIFDEFVAPL